MEVDLLHALDLAGLDETAQLGDGLPLLLVAQLPITLGVSAQFGFHEPGVPPHLRFPSVPMT